MSTFELTRPRKDINFSGAAGPLNTTPAKVGQSYQNTTSGEIFHCTDDTGAVYMWMGTLGTQVLPLAAILATDHPDLTAMYTMDNTIGSTLVDETGNYNAETVSLTLEQGLIAGAIVGGSPRQVNIPNIPEISGTSTRAFSFWAKSTAATNVDLFSSGDGATNSSFKISFGLWNTGDIGVVFNTGNNEIGISTTSSVVSTTYKHYVINFSTTAGTSIYVNSVSQSLASRNGGASSSQNTANSNFALLYDRSAGTRYASGSSLDQFRIFNRVLTQEEITALYQEGL